MSEVWSIIHVSVSVVYSSSQGAFDICPELFEGVTCQFLLSWRLLVHGTLPLGTSPNDPSHHVSFLAVLHSILSSCAIY